MVPSCPSSTLAPRFRLLGPDALAPPALVDTATYITGMWAELTSFGDMAGFHLKGTLFFRRVKQQTSSREINPSATKVFGPFTGPFVVRSGTWCGI